MKKLLLFSFLFLIGVFQAKADIDISGYSWSNICAGKLSADFYGSEQAQALADNVIYIQKANGGWDKNLEIHKYSQSDLESQKYYSEHGDKSCFDNTATTQEMRYLAKVYNKTKVEKYKTAFNNAVALIFKAEKSKGGWGQYWPLSGGGSYQDYITFNDDLTVNVLKILRDIYNNKGDFADICDEATREKCKKAFDLGVECILKCQYDDNGTKAAWCAQHDTIDFLPTEGRPHELPSISGYESSAILSFLMSIEDPSEEIQTAITAAVEWLDNHAYKRNAAIEGYTNASGESDRHIVEKSGSDVWGRFIQLGGESGKKVYNKLFQKLNDLNKKRTYGEYTYTEYEIASSSYDASKAYQPIYSIYDNTLQHLYYRFLYNYEDTDPVTDSKGCSIVTSLNAKRRVSYQFLGSWCYNVIHTQYPQWKAAIEAKKQAGDAKAYVLDKESYIEQTTPSEGVIGYSFNDGFSITNAKSKGYANGTGNTIKYSANDYTINIPEGLTLVKATFAGYDNYPEADSYIKKFNGVNYGSTDYVFPKKDADGTANNVSLTIDITDKPATGSVVFGISGKQCCLVITLYCIEGTTEISSIGLDQKNSNIYTLDGRLIKANSSDEEFLTLPSGSYVKGKKVIMKR